MAQRKSEDARNGLIKTFERPVLKSKSKKKYLSTEPDLNAQPSVLPPCRNKLEGDIFASEIFFLK
jgi:hypothetical protein